MTKTTHHTEGANWEQNREYRAICQAAREEKAIHRASAAKKRKSRPRINIDSLPKGKWDVRKLRRAPLPRTGKTYPYHGSKRGGLAP